MAATTPRRIPVTRVGQKPVDPRLRALVDYDPDFPTISHFLCCIVDREEPSCDEVFVDIPWPLRSPMMRRIHSHDFGHGFLVPQGWAGTPIAETNRARVLACLWLAHEAEEEG